MKGQVVVRLRAEVLDPQGVTIGKALEHLGYDSVASLRQGKVFDIELRTDDVAQAERELTAMAKALLANTVTETFEVRVLPGSKGQLPGPEGQPPASEEQPPASEKP